MTSRTCGRPRRAYGRVFVGPSGSTASRSASSFFGDPEELADAQAPLPGPANISKGTPIAPGALVVPEASCIAPSARYTEEDLQRIIRTGWDAGISTSRAPTPALAVVLVSAQASTNELVETIFRGLPEGQDSVLIVFWTKMASGSCLYHSSCQNPPPTSNDKLAGVLPRTFANGVVILAPTTSRAPSRILGSRSGACFILSLH